MQSERCFDDRDVMIRFMIDGCKRAERSIRNSALKYLPVVWDWDIDYFATTPPYRISACLKHILQKRVANLNEILLTLMQSLGPRNIEQIVQILLDIPFSVS